MCFDSYGGDDTTGPARFAGTEAADVLSQNALTVAGRDELMPLSLARDCCLFGFNDGEEIDCRIFSKIAKLTDNKPVIYETGSKSANNAIHLSRPLVILVDLPGSRRPGDGKR